jgi:hypothetical protein
MICATESIDSVAALFKASGLNESLKDMEGAEVQVAGQPLRIRCFLLGDHMLQYKATGADGQAIKEPFLVSIHTKKIVFNKNKQKTTFAACLGPSKYTTG